MASLRDIKRRIKSVKNTQQITRAMKLVSAAKMKRAQEAILAARPYAMKMMDVMSSLACRVDTTAHPLLSRREEKNIMLVVITSDKGLCGGFNGNIIRRTLRFMEDKGRNNISLVVVGKKGRDYFRAKKYGISKEYVDFFRVFSYQRASLIVKDIIDGYTSEQVDSVYVVYNEFKSVIQQRVVAESLLSIPPLVCKVGEEPPDYLYEPSAEVILDDLLKKYVEIEVYRALLESISSEHGARMTAMDSATRNASEMISGLTLTYNRARQAAITKELIEIVSGADALK
ncbi:MAG: ATP synthase F1 subunit gamma [Nitrospinae bacterium]|nr:ATP synthase F1 subunit gamma [Nitrospinota bacterium]